MKKSLEAKNEELNKEVQQLKKYTKRKDVPINLFPKTRPGFKLKVDSKPEAIYYNAFYKIESFFYDESCFSETKKRKSSPITKDIVSESLYVVNKYAKLKPYLYDTKELVIDKCEEFGWVDRKNIHYSVAEDRRYIIYNNYDSEESYYHALSLAEEDDFGRPYINTGKKCYLVFNYFEIGEFGFHSKPERVNKEPIEAIKIDDNFVAPREITKSDFSLVKSVKILNRFLKDDYKN